MAIDSVIHTNEQSIDRVLKTGLPVVLVFWWRETWDATADRWLDALASEFAGRALIAKVNGSEERGLAQRYGAHGQTTYVFLNRQGTAATLRGNQKEADVRAWLAFLVGSGPRPAQPDGDSPRRANGEAGPLHLTDATFHEAISGQTPVLVDFWAEWCGPCRMVAPAIEQLAREFAGRAVVAKLNVDENPRTTQAYQIMSIPAIYIFRNGQVVDRMVGAQPVQVLRQRLERHTAAG